MIGIFIDFVKFVSVPILIILEVDPPIFNVVAVFDPIFNIPLEFVSNPKDGFTNILPFVIN